jgi:hypothetical protein
MSVGTSRWGRRAACLIALSAVVTAIAGPALASPRETQTRDKPVVVDDRWTEADDLAVAQQPLVTAATAISALDPKGNMLGGVRLQVEKQILDVYWKGDLPGEVEAEIARQREAGVDVVVTPAPYSSSELRAAQKLIVDSADRYPGLSVLAPRPEADGLVAYVTDPKKAQNFEFPVPVTIESGEALPLFGRNDDTPPFWGGASVRINGGGCTTGFAVKQMLIGEISRGILSAGHCDPSGHATWTTPTGRVLGTTTRVVPWSDTAYVRTSSAGRVYTGPVGSTTSKAILGPVPNFPGQFVCTEGAATGEHCFVQNFFVGAVTFVNGWPVFGVTLATNITGGFAAGQGDSGGPVIMSSNPVAGLAAGIISVGLFPTRCSQETTQLCSNTIGYVDINWALLTNALVLV